MDSDNLLGQFLRARRGLVQPEEQGRVRNPSVQVVDALARALLLDDEATTHLHRLARPVPGRSRRHPSRQRVSPALARMMNSWDGTPAVILGRCMDVLAHNSLGVPCSPATPTAGT